MMKIYLMICLVLSSLVCGQTINLDYMEKECKLIGHFPEAEGAPNLWGKESAMNERYNGYYAVRNHEVSKYSSSKSRLQKKEGCGRSYNFMLVESGVYINRPYPIYYYKNDLITRTNIRLLSPKQWCNKIFEKGVLAHLFKKVEYFDENGVKFNYNTLEDYFGIYDPEGVTVRITDVESYSSEHCLELVQDVEIYYQGSDWDHQDPDNYFQGGNLLCPGKNTRGSFVSNILDHKTVTNHVPGKYNYRKIYGGTENIYELCMSPDDEYCDSGEDDNGDGIVDCDDPNCIGREACDECDENIPSCYDLRQEHEESCYQIDPFLVLDDASWWCNEGIADEDGCRTLPAYDKNARCVDYREESQNNKDDVAEREYQEEKERAKYTPEDDIDPSANADCGQGNTKSDGDPIGVVNGSQVLIRPDLSFGFSGNFEIKSFYHSKSTFNGQFGYGWNNIATVRLFKIKGSSGFVLRDEIGRKENFSSTGTNQSKQSSIYNLVIKTDGYQFKRSEGQIWEFDKNGALLSVHNGNGGGVTFEYVEEDNKVKDFPIMGVSYFSDEIPSYKEVAQDYQVSKIKDKRNPLLYLSFEYDVNGHVWYIYKKKDGVTESQVEYNYDVFGNIHTFKDATDNMIVYAFGDNDLSSVETSKNFHNLVQFKERCADGEDYNAVRNYYDEFGRVSTQEYLGAKYNFSYSPVIVELAKDDEDRDVAFKIKKTEVDVEHIRPSSVTEGAMSYETIDTIWTYATANSSLNKRTTAINYTYKRQDVTGSQIEETKGEYRVKNEKGYLLYEKDLAGSGITYTYTPNLQVKSIVKVGFDQINSYQKFKYNSFLKLESDTIGVLGRGEDVRSYEYSTDGEYLLKIKHWKNDLTSFSEEVFTYYEAGDVLGKLKTKKSLDGIEKSYSYVFTEDTLQKTTTYPNSTQMLEKFSDNGALLERVDQNNAKWVYLRTEDDRLKKKTLPNGVEVEYQYDPTSEDIYSPYLRKMSTSALTDSEEGFSQFWDYNKYGQKEKQYTIVNGTAVPDKKWTYSTNGKVAEEYEMLSDESDWLLIGESFYNALGELEKKKNVDGNYAYFEYDLSGNLIKSKDAAGYVEENSYNSLNEKVSFLDKRNFGKAEADQLKEEWTYNHRGQPLSFTNRLNQKTIFEYDHLGNKVKQIGFQKDTSIWVWDYNKNVISKFKNAENDYFVYKYDTLNNLTKEVRKVGDTSLVVDATDFVYDYEYDTRNNRTRKKTNSTTEYDYKRGYNTLGQLQKDTLLSDRILRLSYTGFGEIDSIVDETNDVVRVKHYNAHKKEFQEELDGVVQTKRYFDSYGRITSLEQFPNGTTTYGYDRRNKLTEVEGFGVFRDSLFYNNIDKVIRKKTRLGFETLYLYDELGRLKQKTLGNSDIESYSYDELGRLSSYQDGVLTEWTAKITKLAQAYSDKVKIDTTIFPDQTKEIRKYDRLGRMVEFQNVSNESIVYSYNDLGFLESRAHGSNEITYTYTEDGLIESVENSESIIEIEYNDAKQKVLEKMTIGSETFEIGKGYDLVNLVDTLHYDNTTSALFYKDGRNRLDSVYYSGSRIAHFMYDINNLDSIEYGNGASIKKMYNANGEFNTLTLYNSNGTILSKIQKSLAPKGSPRVIYRNSDPDQQQTLFVDGELQMTGYWMGAGSNRSKNFSYTYDARGNRTATTESSTLSYTTNSVDEYTGINIGATPEVVTFNTEGQLSKHKSNEFTWDIWGHLVSVEKNNETTEYIYDGLGRKIKKKLSDGTSKIFVHFGDQVVREVSTVTKNFVFGNYLDEPILVDNNGTKQYFVQGVNYTTEALLDDNGDLIEQYVVDPFGNFSVTTNTGSHTSSTVGNQYVFQGREYDPETNLYYFRNRWYSPDLGRFVSRDPLRHTAGDINLYRFVGNSPYEYLDPYGLCNCSLPMSDEFWKGYPNYEKYDAEEVWKKIGGSLEKSYGEDHPEGSQNSCAVRVSSALNKSGHKIPKGTDGGNRNWGGDNERYVIKARKLNQYLKKKYGDPTKTLESEKDLKVLKDGLDSGQVALVSAKGHIGVVKDDYSDDYIGGSLGDVWILPTEGCSCQ